MISNSDYPTVSSSKPSTDIHFSLWQTFKSHIPRLLLTILFDMILPLILFLLLQKRIKSVYALLIAGIPPLVMVLFKALLARTFDAFAFLVFISFLLSTIVTLVTHNDIIFLLEKSLVTGVVSLTFGMTLIPFRCCCWRWRPIAYYFYQDLVPTRRVDVGLPDCIFDDREESISERHGGESPKQEVTQVYEWIYEHCSSFRLACYLITSIWSIGFLLEFLTRLILILMHLSIDRIVIYGHIILSLVTVVCIILTIICLVKERKQTLTSIQQWTENNQLQSRQSHLLVWAVTDANNPMIK